MECSIFVCVCAFHLMTNVDSVLWGAGQVAVPSSFTVILWQRQMGVIMPEGVDRNRITNIC